MKMHVLATDRRNILFLAIFQKALPSEFSNTFESLEKIPNYAKAMAKLNIKCISVNKILACIARRTKWQVAAVCTCLLKFRAHIKLTYQWGAPRAR